MNVIWEENRAFLSEKYTHDTDFLKFVWDVTHLYTDPIDKRDATMATIRFFTRFMIDIGSRTRTDSPVFDIWVMHTRRLYTNNTEACRWLLSMLSQEDKFVSLLLQCPSERVRRAFTSIILHAMAHLVPQERPLYPRYLAVRQNMGGGWGGNKEKKDRGKDKEGKANDQEADPDSPAALKESTVIKFVEFLISLLRTVRRNMRHSAQYFNLIYDFALMGIEEKKYLLGRQIISEFIEFYLQIGVYEPVVVCRGKDESQRYGRSGGQSSTTTSATKLNAPSLAGLVQTVALLVRCTDPQNEKDLLPPTLYDTENILVLPRKDSDLLLETAFLIQLVKDGTDPLSTISILKHFSWEDRKRSKMFLFDLKEAVNKSTHMQLRSFFRVIKHLLVIPDSIQEARVEFIVVALHKALGHQISNKDAMSAAIKFIHKLYEKQDKVKAFVSKNKTLSNEILDNYQRLVQAEKEREKEANSATRSSFASAFKIHHHHHK